MSCRPPPNHRQQSSGASPEDFRNQNGRVSVGCQREALHHYRQSVKKIVGLVIQNVIPILEQKSQFQSRP